MNKHYITKHKMKNQTMGLAYLYFHLFIIISVASAVRSEDSDCVYTIYVRTGSVLKAGSDSIMSVTLYDANGWGVRIKNLESWGGLMGPGYNYFERGNLDIFSGKGPCLSAPVCSMNLTSDGSGQHHGWYCNYVEVTSTGAHVPCAQKTFTVEQWLATDTSPYELTALRNYCKATEKDGGARKMLKGSGSDREVI